MGKEDCEALDRIIKQLNDLLIKYVSNEDVNTGYLQDAIDNLLDMRQ